MLRKIKRQDVGGGILLYILSHLPRDFLEKRYTNISMKTNKNFEVSHLHRDSHIFLGDENLFMIV